MISAGKKLTVLVSSAVYDIEELLERIYTLLTSFGYEVWMSHKGTVPVFSDQPAFDNCIAAVEKCDLFLGIITPHYGSGQDADHPELPSITHREMLKAIELKKPRWILAHDHVVFARLLLNNLSFKGREGRKTLTLAKRPILDDLRVLDLYEDATIDSHDIPLAERDGNWVQKFSSTEDGAVFVSAQFFRYQEVEQFIRENFADGQPLNRPGGSK